MMLTDFQDVQCFDMEWRFPKVVHYESGNYRVSLCRDEQWVAVFLEPTDRGGPIPHILGWGSTVEHAMELCAVHREYVEGRKQVGVVDGQWRDVYAKAKRSAKRRVR